MNIISVLSLMLSTAALILSLLQFRSERMRTVRFDTITAFDVLDEKVFRNAEYHEIRDQLNDHELYQLQDFQRKARKHLAYIEHFCLSVNLKMYDIVTLYKLAGSLFMRQYDVWEPYIQSVRTRTGNDRVYKEFEQTVKKIRQMRTADSGK